MVAEEEKQHENWGEDKPDPFAADGKTCDGEGDVRAGKQTAARGGNQASSRTAGVAACAKPERGASKEWQPTKRLSVKSPPPKRCALLMADSDMEEFSEAASSAVEAWSISSESVVGAARINRKPAQGMKKRTPAQGEGHAVKKKPVSKSLPPRRLCASPAVATAGWSRSRLGG